MYMIPSQVWDLFGTFSHDLEMRLELASAHPSTTYISVGCKDLQISVGSLKIGVTRTFSSSSKLNTRPEEVIKLTWSVSLHEG